MNKTYLVKPAAAVVLGMTTILLPLAPAFAQPASQPANSQTVATTSTQTTTTSTVSTPAPLPAITATPGSPEEVAQLRALVEALTSRLQGIEAAQKKTDEAVTKNVPTVSSREKVVVSGLLQVRGDLFSNQEGPGAEQFDTQRIRRAEVRLTAPQITPRISGTVMFDFAKRFGTTLSNSNNYFQEAQISYLLRKGRAEAGATPNNIYIDAGQFKIPVGYEGDLVSSSALPTIERALMFAARDPFGGGFGDVRDTGVQIRGNQGDFRYWVGAFNGLGERQNNLSTSDTRALVARLAYAPRRVQGLIVGVSGARGNNRNVSTVGGVDQRADRSLVNAFVNYQRNKWTFRGEYLTGDSQRLPLNDAGFDNDVQGYYAHIGYMFTPKIEGVLRYDTFDFDRDLSDARVRDIVAGVNYYIKGNNAKIQANIVRRSGAGGLAGNGFSSSLVDQFANDRTEFRLQGQVAF